MFAIIKAEIIYHRLIFINCTTAIILIGFLGHLMPLESINSLFFMMIPVFIMLQNWFSFRNKEKREHLIARLPVPVYQIGLIRILAVHFAILIGVVFYSISCLSGFSKIEFQLSNLFKFYIFFIFSFSVYFIFRDSLLAFFRKKGITLNMVILLFFLIILGLNILTIVAFVQAKNATTNSVTILTFIDYLVYHRFFAGVTGTIKFIFSIIFFSVITVITFNRRKTYLE